MSEDSNWGEDSIKVKISKEMTKVRALSCKDKLTYFRTYYLIPTIVLVTAIIAISMFIYNVTLGRNSNIIVGSIINVDLTGEGEEYLGEGFTEYFHDGKKSKKYTAGISLYDIGFDENNVPYNSEYNDVMSLNSLIMAGAIDYVIVGENAIPYTKAQEYYNILTEIADDKFMEENKERLLYAENPENGEEIPIGVNLKGTNFGDKYIENPDNAYLIFVAGSNQAENATKFLEYIMK